MEGHNLHYADESIIHEENLVTKQQKSSYLTRESPEFTLSSVLPLPRQVGPQ